MKRSRRLSTACAGVLAFAAFSAQTTGAYAHCAWNHPGHCIPGQIRELPSQLERLPSNVVKELERLPGNIQELPADIIDIAQRLGTEAAVETLGLALSGAMKLSRDNARSAGTQPVPQHLRPALARLFPNDLLDRVRYRIGQGNDLSVQANSIRFGDAGGVALIDTVVFASADGANDDELWAHELAHIQQYQRWGTTDFAKRYVRDYQAVEDEANEVQAQYAALGDFLPNQDLANSCQHAFDNDCDEPGIGTGLCSAGTDTADCSTPASANSCRYAHDGECDHPGLGTGSCPPNTDQDDCSANVMFNNLSPPTPPNQAPIPIASACFTPFGACPMGVALPVGSQCYCPSFQGPVWGFAQ
jgi:hypothetical protein